MNELPSRFHRLKLILTGLLLTIAGGSLIAFNRSIDPDGTSWIASIPWAEFGSIIIGAGVLGIWLDYLFRQEQQAADEARLRAIMRDQAPLMRDAVLDAFAANHEDLQRVARPDTLDRIATTSLALRLGDHEFAGEIYADLQRQVIDTDHAQVNFPRVAH